eukprot:7278461-Prymnesium_polylepis.1
MTGAISGYFAFQFRACRGSPWGCPATTQKTQLMAGLAALWVVLTAKPKKKKANDQLDGGEDKLLI